MSDLSELHVRRAKTRVTREGWYWLVASGFLIAVGWFKAINLLMLLGYPMLLLWAINLIVAWRRLRRVRVWRRAEEPIFAGTPFRVGFEVENTSRRPQPGVALEATGPDHRIGHYFAALGRTGRERFHETVILPRRGWYTDSVCRVTSSYPFGLAERRLVLSADRSLLVLPALGTLHRGRLRRFLAEAAPSVGRSRQRPVHHAAAQNDFHGLRPFRAGDSPRWIHWRTSARRGELMVREFEEEPNENLILVVEPWLPADANRASGPDNAAALLEDVLSMAATITWDWCRRTGDRLLLAVAGPVPLVVDGLTGRDHALLVLECLAVQPGTPAPDAGRLAERLAARPLPHAPVLVLSPRPSPLGEVVARRLGRPVAALDLSDPHAQDFFEREPAHAP